MKILPPILVSILMASCTSALHVQSDGLVNYAGRQADIVGQNSISGLVPVDAMSGSNGMYGLGAYEGLDGEITIFEGRPYITQVRGDSIVMRHDTDASAIFAAWTTNDTWRDVPIPPDVSSYVDLQRFIRARAVAAGLDAATTAFPFLIVGEPAELEWHINIDRTNGHVVTRELFQASKDNYVMRNEAVTIVGFYSEQHHGTFIGTYAPAMADSGEQNVMHLHLVSADGLSAGHIDNLQFAGDMVLKLPQ